MMNKLVIAVAAGAMLTAANPAFATDHIVSGKKVGVDARIASLETRFHDGITSGRIDRSEARTLREKIVKLDELAKSYKSDGFTMQEQAVLRTQINFAREDLQRADGSSGYAVWRDKTRLGFGG
jgi:hypothetical protein